MKAMTIDELKELISEFETISDWSLQLLRFNNSERTGITYISRKITLSPVDRLNDYIQSISNRYTQMPENKMGAYQNIESYDGTTDGATIYAISINNKLLNSAYKNLVSAVAQPDQEIDPLSFDANAFLLRGTHLFNENGKNISKPLEIISMQKPFTVLKNKFSFTSNETFKEIHGKVLNLAPNVDAIIYDDVVYMFTLASEKLFNMERAYKIVCSKNVDDIVACDFITDIDSFQSIATRGHNPRRFVSFNRNRLKQLQNPINRQTIAGTFSIPLQNGKFDTSQDGISEKIIKLLCDKGMVDPFENIPVEVSSSKNWI